MEAPTSAIQKYSSEPQGSTQSEDLSSAADSDLSDIAETPEEANQQGDSSMKDIFHTETEITSTQNSEPRTTRSQQKKRAAESKLEKVGIKGQSSRTLKAARQKS